MKTPSFHDVEQISAFLDGQLSQAEKSRLETRIRSDLALAALLADLRQARAILQRTPKRPRPRNFTLTPKMAGIKPPVPRAVPALGWASAVAAVLFVFTLGTNFLSQISFGAAAPMLAAPQMTSEDSGRGGGPAATQPAAMGISQDTPTPEIVIMTTPEVTSTGEASLVEPPVIPAAKPPPVPVNIWPYIWLGLAAVLVTAALLIRQASIVAFRRKVGMKK
jgi:hypothetical protein